MRISDEKLKEIIQTLVNLDWHYCDETDSHSAIEYQCLKSPKGYFKFRNFDFRVLKVDWVKFLPLKLSNDFVIANDMAIFSDVIAINLKNC